MWKDNFYLNLLFINPWKVFTAILFQMVFCSVLDTDSDPKDPQLIGLLDPDPYYGI